MTCPSCAGTINLPPRPPAEARKPIRISIGGTIAKPGAATAVWCSGIAIAFFLAGGIAGYFSYSIFADAANIMQQIFAALLLIASVVCFVGALIGAATAGIIAAMDNGKHD